MNRQQLLALIVLHVTPVFALAGPPDAAPQPELVMFGAPVSETALSNHRGARDVTINEQITLGTVHGNNAINTVSGANMVMDQAFNGMNGFTTVIQNSGNNVLIQNSTILNVKVQ